MTFKLKIRRIGNSTGVVIPKLLLRRLKFAEGDHLHFTDAPSGFLITAADPEFNRQMTIAERGLKRYRNALRKLAN